MSGAREIDVGAQIEAHQGSRYSLVILAVCSVAMIVEGYDVQVVAYAAPAIIRDWHIDKSYFGPVFGAAMLGYLLGATLLSGLSDVFGRKRVVALGNVFFGVLTVASAFATTIPVLLALRFIAGLGLGCAIPAAIALAVEYAPESRRAFRVSILYVAYPFGGAFGGVLTAALIVRFGWQSAFFFGGCISIALGLLAFFVMPESVRFLALLGNRDGEIAAIMRRLGPDLAISPGTRFTIAERKAERGFPVRHLFTDGRGYMTILLWVAFITSLAGGYFLTSWLPTVLEASGVPLAHAIIAGSLVLAGAGTGGLAVGYLVDRVGTAAIMGAYVLSIPFVVLVGMADLPEYLLMPMVFLAGFFLFGGQTGLNALAGTIYPTFARSSGVGWALGVGRIGSILGPVVGGVLMGAGLSMQALFVCAAIPAAFAAVSAFLLGRLMSGPPASTTTRYAVAPRRV